MAGEGPLFLAEAPDLQDTLVRWELHPELEIVTVGVAGRRETANGDSPAARHGLQGHDEHYRPNTGARTGLGARVGIDDLRSGQCRSIDD